MELLKTTYEKSLVPYPIWLWHALSRPPRVLLPSFTPHWHLSTPTLIHHNFSHHLLLLSNTFVNYKANALLCISHNLIYYLIAFTIVFFFLFFNLSIDFVNIDIIDLISHIYYTKFQWSNHFFKKYKTSKSSPPPTYPTHSIKAFLVI